MGNIYVKLKDDYCNQKDAMAKDIYGQLIYPGQNRFVVFQDTMLPLIEKHRDFEFLEIKSQDVINEEKKQYQEEISDIVSGNYKRAEKLINHISDEQKLKDIKKTASANDRQSIVKLVNGRLEELSL